MNHNELNRMLCRKSPFVLKKENNAEDQLCFTWNQVAVNQQVIGLYGIKESTHCVIILLDESGGHGLNETILIELCYRGKPVLLKLASKYDKTFLELPELEGLPKLVPQGECAVSNVYC